MSGHDIPDNFELLLAGLDQERRRSVQAMLEECSVLLETAGQDLRDGNLKMALYTLRLAVTNLEGLGREIPGQDTPSGAALAARADWLAAECRLLARELQEEARR